MIETIGPRGHTAGRATTLAACLTFTLGALGGGAVTFGSLALAGSLLQGGDSTAAYLTAAAIAAVGGVLELRGVAILPQVRRQLPEHWRRLMPMPLAAALYGVLLGLGFTTFVLTFGVFALAAIAFAVGDPETGLVIGVAFGLARALPVALVAPIADRDAGIAVTEAMAGRPAIYRGFRAGDGVALLAAAAGLLVVVPAGASRNAVRPAADPAVTGHDVVFQRPDRSGFVRRGGRNVPLPGRDPAAGDGRIAVVDGARIVILSAKDLGEIGSVPADDVDAVAISRRWLAWREHRAGHDSMHARGLADPAHPGPIKRLGRSGQPAQLGRPSVSGNVLVYARATRKQNVIVRRRLAAGHHKRAKGTVMRSRTAGLSNPALRGRKLVYVRTTRRGDVLKLTSLGGHGSGRTLMRTHGTLWSTALTAKRAYVTVISGTGPRQRIVSVGY